MLTISVKNFGPITEGSVDLKPLTIFVGPSNTGKSYMATAVHTVLKGFVADKLDFSLSYPEYDDYLGMMDGIRQSLLGQSEEELSQKTLPISTLPDWIILQIDELIQEGLKAIQLDVIKGMHVALAISEEAFYQVGSEVNVWRDDPLLRVVHPLSDDMTTAPELSLDLASISLAEFDLTPPLPGLYGSGRPYSEIVDSLNESIEKLVLSEFPNASFYLPAARSGMAESHKALVNAVLRRASRAGIQGIVVPALSDKVAEFLSYLVVLGPGTRRKGSPDLDNTIMFIENSVLCGRVDLDASEGLPYPEITYRSTSGKFLLSQSSSMVSELAPLVLFLKYLIRPGDLLILEEPESHLHPAAQRQLARGIVRLVNAGVKVLITTHSDIIISQVNNLLALRQASPELIEGGGFEPEDFLEPEQVGAYLFRYSPELGGCETVPLEIDPDTGIDEDEFAKVFEAMYDETIALQRDRG